MFRKNVGDKAKRGNEAFPLLSPKVPLIGYFSLPNMFLCSAETVFSAASDYGIPSASHFVLPMSWYAMISAFSIQVY